MNTEITETVNGWVFHDGTCGFCRGWVERTRDLLLRRGYHFVPLQARWARERLGVSEDEPLAEMKLLTGQGRTIGGADALLKLASVIWWLWPFWALAHFPGTKPVLRRLYRRLAANRHCFGGRCELSERQVGHAGKITSAFYELP